ncbi:MAG: hypothetical protein LAQ30_00695 [Acidobacteriia bacterium]|nr:hypothetical protein [Terriglobia bacterium]
MKCWFRLSALALSFFFASPFAPGGATASAQEGGSPRVQERQRDDVTLPNGKSQKDEMLKAEHEQNLKDAAQLVELSQGLKDDLEKNDRFVLSLATLKKTDEIEKLVKKIRSRLRHN